MNRKWLPFIFLTLLGCMGSVLAIHGRELAGIRRKADELRILIERQRIPDRLLTRAEKYRRQSAKFRFLSAAELASTQAQLKSEVLEGITRLDALSPTPEERELSARVSRKMGEFLALSARLEPWLFTKDVFQKAEAQGLFDDLMADIVELRRSAEQRADGLQDELGRRDSRSLRALGLASGLILLVFALLVAREFFRFSRPIERTLAHARRLRAILPPSRDSRTRKSGPFVEIQETLDALAAAFESQRKERHQFVAAIATDLRAPLLSLKASAEFLLCGGARIDSAGTQTASESLNRSLFRVNRVLEDLTDLAELERSELRLNERIVDLRDLVAGVARMMMSGSNSPACVTAPSPKAGAPLWTLLDPARFERVLVNLVAKTLQAIPHGGCVDLIVSRSEIVIASKGALAGAPHVLEHLRSWVVENGFGIALAHKVLRAHGASLVISGAGFAVRIPEERIAQGAEFGSGAGLEPLELARVQPVFPEQGVNLGS